MKMKYSGVALSVLLVTRKCALSCCGRVGESNVTKGTVNPPKPIGRGGTSARHGRKLAYERGSLLFLDVHSSMCFASCHAEPATDGRYRYHASTDVAGQTHTCRCTPRCGAPSTIVSQADPQR